MNSKNPQVKKIDKKPKKKRDFSEEFFNYKVPFPIQHCMLSNYENIGYMDTKKGDIVCLFIHGGFTCSLNMLSFIYNLRNSVRCIVPCLRGHGYSSQHTPVTSLEDLATDLEELVHDQLKINKFYIISQSNSSALASYFSSTRPQLVLGCV